MTESASHEFSNDRQQGAESVFEMTDPTDTESHMTANQYGSEDVRGISETRNHPSPYAHRHRLLKTLHECAVMCERTIYRLQKHPEASKRSRQLQYLRECADSCNYSIKTVSQKSHFRKQVVDLCGLVCETCGTECLRYTDQTSRICGQMCMQCARECHAYAAS
jgi:hypothetical protein